MFNVYCQTEIRNIAKISFTIYREKRLETSDLFWLCFDLNVAGELRQNLLKMSSPLLFYINLSLAMDSMDYINGIYIYDFIYLIMYFYFQNNQSIQ